LRADLRARLDLGHVFHLRHVDRNADPDRGAVLGVFAQGGRAVSERTGVHVVCDSSLNCPPALIVTAPTRACASLHATFRPSAAPTLTASPPSPSLSALADLPVLRLLSPDWFCATPVALSAW